MNDIFHQPKNTMPEIKSVYAFLSVDPEDGNEGVVAASIGGTMMPLVAADPARVEALKPIATQIAKATHIRIRLVKFTTREEIEEI